MKNNTNWKLKEKAFTLIELLSVIVILAIIALIAVPIILKIIESTRKSAFKDTAYGIMESAKNYYAKNMLNTNSEKEFEIFSFENGEINSLEYSGEKPKGGILTISEDGKIKLAIHNNEWCAIKDTGDVSIKLIKYEEDKCILSNQNTEIEPPKITVKSEQSAKVYLGTDRLVLEYFNTPDSTITCVDTSNENSTITNTNTLELGTHIIKCSVILSGKEISSAEKTVIIEEEIKVEDIVGNEVGENGTVADDVVGNTRLTGIEPNNYVSFNNELWRILGIFDGHMKIIRAESIGKKAWNTSESNNWSTSSLQKELNTTYLNSIDSLSKSYIDTAHVWNLGGETTAKITRAKMYESERGTITYGSNPKTWSGAIGLMYPSDYAYATDSTNSVCDSSIIFDWNETCKQTNWLFKKDAEQWTITPDSKEAKYAYTVNESGSIRISTDTGIVTLLHEVRPALYLKSNVRIINSDLENAGSKEKPFILSIS